MGYMWSGDMIDSFDEISPEEYFAQVLPDEEELWEEEVHANDC